MGSAGINTGRSCFVLNLIPLLLLLLVVLMQLINITAVHSLILHDLQLYNSSSSAGDLPPEEQLPDDYLQLEKPGISDEERRNGLISNILISPLTIPTNYAEKIGDGAEDQTATDGGDDQINVIKQISSTLPQNRSSFPPDFIFGAASSAYQFEGAANEDGRSPSIWDTFTHEEPEKIKGGANGDVAVEQYHLYHDDVELLKNLGLKAYRFSISWSRVLPFGTIKGGVNKKAIEYYNNLINKLLEEGIKPIITIFHWDIPQRLEEEYNGFLSANVIEDFKNFADLCFKEFGDRVKHWITINEPYNFAVFGYCKGYYAPGRCSKSFGNCTVGNSSTEPYIVAHNMILAHAVAAKHYKQNYQPLQKGIIGLTLYSRWFIPYSNSKADAEAMQRALDFMLGWYMDPITKGKYSKTMRSLVGRRLPRFTKEEAKVVKGSFDFVGLNYYTTYYVADGNSSVDIPSILTDSQTNQTAERGGVLIGPKTAISSIYLYPEGIEGLTLYVKNTYNNIPVIITENGYGEYNNNTLTLQQSLSDTTRTYSLSAHISYLHSAISKGADVRGYLVWALMDNFEWSYGYSVRFGLVYVDYNNNLTRHPKQSAVWFKTFLST